MNIERNPFSLQEIKSIFKEKGDCLGDTVFDLLKCFDLTALCRKTGIVKLKGYTVDEILTVLFCFPFMLLKTVRGFIMSGYSLTQAKKDAFFRFLNDEKVNWRKMLYSVAKNFQVLASTPEEVQSVTCGILDDTIIKKTGGKIEGIGRVKLFFSRFSHRGQWQLMITTDLSLSYIKTMEIYCLRWGIEVLLKECKQHLNLGKCQSNDFDAQIAETTIGFMLYTMLAFYKRVHAYESIGGLFAQLKDQLTEAPIAERLWVLFIELQQLVAEVFEIDINEYFDKLTNSEKAEALLRSLIGAMPSRQMEEQIDKAA